MRIVGLVQARMGSTRLPGKVLKPLAGRPLVGHIFDRLRATRGVSDLVLATTMDPRNDPLASFAASERVHVFRAHGEDDIAERLAGAARLTRAGAVLKVNGDCPLVDPAILEQLVTRYGRGDVDYVSNKIRWTWPEGLSAEVISSEALYKCEAELKDATTREFVANYIRDSSTAFRVASVEGALDLTRYKWSVDTPEDFEEIEKIFASCYPQNPLFGLSAVLSTIAS